MKSKIKSLQQLKKIVKLHKLHGQSVVLANGCFDLLHVGHIRYLEASKKLGDVLIVAINNDRSVRAIKDPGRPIIKQQARAEIVASLAAVDYVVLFGEKQVDRVLLALQPSIQAKGTDYTVDSVPERALVKSYGGSVAIAGDRKDHATKDLIKTIIQKYRKG
ncbi:MAG: adenylyltransferase/cytidyltransferase family protein [bacterium]|nr:adenylyltransferase/cytidyltransferase family protein [bacterium]MDD5354288.1 adenylyltransferase/cytidyltransferase family protein [bacterium]MDD5755724.1 adenylyltransferase/cytidyltransferase family protein [bacterium]